MNALIRKEVRLLLPLWGVAILLIATPAALSRAGVVQSAATLLMAGVAIPFVTALGAFGREFSNGTFSSLIALPISRSRLWWTKVGVLACALLSIYGVWWFSFHICATRWPEFAKGAPDDGVTPLTSALFLFTAFAGGLWTTLLFRQLAAAIWFTILIPIALLMGAGAVTERFTSDPGHYRIVLNLVLLIYGSGGFLLAWRLFLRAEDAQWTGGVIALPRLDILFQRTGTTSILRKRRPIAALFRKELQLHHASLLIASLLFFLHIGIIAFRTFGGAFTKEPIIAELLAVFWGLWLIMPLLIGATAVAEERKLGVAQAQLCQPIGWRRQLMVKLLVALALGVFLGAVPSWALEYGHQMPNLFSGPDSLREPIGALITLTLLSALIAMVAFHASTLARNTLQAIGIAVVLLMLGSFALSFLERPEIWLDSVLWRGDLGLIIGWPVIVLVAARLAWGNFKCPQPAGREWRQNLSALAAAVAIVVTSASAIYHRAWELPGRIELPHGAARLAVTDSFAMRHDGGLSLLSTDGSLEAFRPSFVVRANLNWIWRNHGVGSLTWTRQSHGTNWRSAVAGHFDTVAIRTDGSLWVSEAPTPRVIRSPEPPPAAALERFGLETNWRQVVRDPREGRSFFLLKSDGTLWRWRDTNRFSAKLPLAQIEPRQAGADSDWSRLWAAGTRVYLTKTDGRVWGLNTAFRSSARNSFEIEPGLPLELMTEFAGVEWRSVSGLSMFDLRVRPDGSLWAVGILPWNRRQPAEQLDESSDWKAVSGNFNSAIALKEDGSLWKMDLGTWNTKPVLKRLSQYSDWIAVASSHDEHFAFAADGIIRSWEARAADIEFRTASFKLPAIELAPSRIPKRIGSILDAPIRTGERGRAAKAM